MEWNYGGGGNSGYNGGNEKEVWDCGGSKVYNPRTKACECPDGMVDNGYECVVEEVEIINNLTGKEKCLHDLLTKNGTNFVKDLLKNFEGESEFDIRIKSEANLINPTTKKESGGLTYPPNSKNMILIVLNSSSINKKSALEAAKTILHEYIHADIYRKLLTKENSSKEILIFTDTYNKYKEQFSYELQHQTMGYLYVNSMRDALKTFHKTVLKSDYSKYIRFNGHEPSDIFYEALAWRGLKEHNVEAYKDIDPEKIKKLEAVDLDIDFLTKDCKDAQ